MYCDVFLYDPKIAAAPYHFHKLPLPFSALPDTGLRGAEGNKTTVH